MKAPEIFRLAILKLMEETKTTQSVLADSLKIKRPHMNAYIKGTRGFSEDKREDLAGYFGKTYLELLDFGREITTKKPTPETPDPIIITVTSDQDKEHLVENASNYRSVPLYTSGRLAAWSNGMTFNPYETATSQVLVYTPELGHRAKHNLVAAKVGGDSMEPLIPENSIIVIDLDDREYVDNKIFVISIDEGGTQTGAVKRVRKFEEAEGFLLLSENTKERPRIIQESNWLRLCVGRVVWMWRSFER